MRCFIPSVVAACALILPGCSSKADRAYPSDSAGTAGTDTGTSSNKGGAGGTSSKGGGGGMTSNGGTTSRGGTSAAGGIANNSGGTTVSGGQGGGTTSGTGGTTVIGTTAMGGAGGTNITGTTATGGTATTTAGGTTAKGGGTSTGGTTGLGGTSSKGGTTAMGGTTATGGTTASSSGVPACDANGDGLDESPTCITSPVYLRFVNATPSYTFDVYVTGAAKAVTTGLAAYQVVTVGPVQAKLLDYEFRTSGVVPVAGEVNLVANNRYSLVAYVDPTTTVPTLKTNSGTQLTAGGCGTSSAQVAFGQFTTLTPNPVVILYTTTGGTSWVAPISPGLGVGQIFGSGCWNGGSSIQFGSGPAAATTPTYKYQALSFTSGLTYQLLMTNDRMIVIDNLDRVTNMPKL